MSTIIWQALGITVLLTLISGPVFWSDSLSRWFFELDKKRKAKAASKEPPRP